MARQRYLVLGSGLEFCAGSLPCHDQEVSRNGYGKGQQESAGYGRNFPAYFYGLDGKAKIFLFPVHGYIYIYIYIYYDKISNMDTQFLSCYASIFSKPPIKTKNA
jgi:hypothetical protein